MGEAPQGRRSPTPHSLSLPMPISLTLTRLGGLEGENHGEHMAESPRTTGRIKRPVSLHGMRPKMFWTEGFGKLNLQPHER